MPAAEQVLDPEQDRHRSDSPASGSRRCRARPGHPDGSAARSPWRARRRSGGLLAHVPAGREHERGADHALVADRHDRLPDRPPARRAASAGGRTPRAGSRRPAAGNPGRGPRSPPSRRRLRAQLGQAPALGSAPSPSRSADDRSSAPDRSACAAVSRARRSGLLSQARLCPRRRQAPRRHDARGRAPRARDRRGPGCGRSSFHSVGPWRIEQDRGHRAHGPDRLRRRERRGQLGGGLRDAALAR